MKYGNSSRIMNGLYEVSNLGRVKSLERKVKAKNRYGIVERTITEKILKYTVNHKGYYLVKISNQVNKSFAVHRLVAEAFIDNVENKPQVNHINGDKKDNRACNLEWCTNGENQKHAINTGLINIDKRIERLNEARRRLKRKPIEAIEKIKKRCLQYDKQMNLIKEWESISEASRKLKIGNSNITECCKGKRKTAGNYIWKFKGGIINGKEDF